MPSGSNAQSYIQPGQGGYAGPAAGAVAPGSSSSSGFPIQTPQNTIMDQISGVASGYASQLMQWAQGQFSKTSAITDQAVNNFFQVSQQMQGMSKGMIDQYNNLFAPENKQLVADANSYASPTRLATDMGAAGATAAQAGQAAEQNSLQQLQQFGIDPSSGRYAGLINADNVQNAANVAGQENLQNRADVATGQQLRAEAVQVGAQLPSSIANVENTGIQANAGAENAELANANTGANLMGLPNNYLQTAMGIKMPFSGSTSQSQQFPPSISSPGGGKGGGDGGGSGGGNGGGSGGGNNPGNGQPSAYQAGAMGGPGSPYGGAIGGQTFGGGKGAPGISSTGGGTRGIGQSPGGGDQSDPFSLDAQNPWSGDQMVNPGAGPTTDLSQTFNDQGGGASAWNPDFNKMGDTSGMFGGQWNDPSNSFDSNPGVFGNAPPPNTTDLGGFDPTQGGGGYNTTTPQGWQDSTVTTDYSAPPSQDISSNYDPNAYGGDSSGGDWSSADSGGGDSYFARGGAVPQHMRTPPRYKMPNMMAQGGQVPAQASPSGGQQTDDVRAQGPGQAPMRLNANEFVIPQDVALWKGQEFFQNMINDSRKKRMSPGGAPAKPTAKPMGVQ